MIDTIKTVDNLLNHALIISCDIKRQALQRAAFEHAGLTYPKVMPGVTIDNVYNDKKSDLLSEFCNDYNIIFPDYIFSCFGPGYRSHACCAISHVLMVYYALKHNWPFVLVFEDDAWPRIDCKAQLEDYIPRIDKLVLNQQYEVIVLGYAGYIKQKTKEAFPFIKKVTRIAGSQAYIIMSSCFNKYIEFQMTPHVQSYADVIMSSRLKHALVYNNIFAQFNHAQWKTTPAISTSLTDNSQLYYIPAVPVLSDNNIFKNMQTRKEYSTTDITKDYICYEDVEPTAKKYLEEIENNLKT